MPQRDDSDARRAGRRHDVTRRATLAGFGAIVVVPCRETVAAADEGPLRVGVVDGLGFDAAGLSRATRARWGRSAVPVWFTAWGSLADHAAATGQGLIDAAVLPAEPGEAPLPAPPDLRAMLLLRAARPCRIGIALRHPRSEAALRGLWPEGAAVTLLAMPPAMLVGNLKAGVIDAALLLGTDARATAGSTAVPLGQDLARILLPPLTLRLRPGLRDREDPSV